MIDVKMLRPTADELLSGLNAGEAMKARLLFQSGAVEKLPVIAAEMLSGLHVSPALRHQILVAAERKKRAYQAPEPMPVRRKRPAYARFTPAVGMALVLALMIGLGLNYGGNGLLDAPPAGNGISTYNMSAEGGGAGVPQYRSLFVGADSANPPLIAVNGRYYQMLDLPAVSQSLLDTVIADVQTYTDEPSLLPNVGIISNAAQPGTKIYKIAGIDKATMVAAEVDGVTRLFQRVSYASNGLIGDEMFENTLDLYGKVESLELSGVGYITDETTANDLIYMLCEMSTQYSDEIASSGQALTIYLKNGLSLQLAVQDDLVKGCGTWACPEFFQAFEEHLTLN